MQEEGVRDSDGNQKRVGPSLGPNYKLCRPPQNDKRLIISTHLSSYCHINLAYSPVSSRQSTINPSRLIKYHPESLSWVWNNWNWILIERNVWSVVQCLPNWVTACHWVNCMISLYNWQYVSLNPGSVLTLSNYHNLSILTCLDLLSVTTRPGLVKAFARSIWDCRAVKLKK